MELSHNQRLEHLIRSENLNKSKFSDSIGYKPKNLGNYLNGETTHPNGELVINILKYYPTWNIRYWLLGHGAPKIEDDKIVIVQDQNKDAVVQELTEQLALLRQELKRRDHVIEAYEKTEEDKE